MFAEANLTARAFISGRTIIFYRASDRVPRAAAEPPVDWLFSYFPSNEHIFIQRYLIGDECPIDTDTREMKQKDRDSATREKLTSSLVVGARVVGIAVGISVGAFEGPTGRPVVGAGVRGKIGLPVGE